MGGDWRVTLFVVVWGLIAIGLGYAFVRYPGSFADIYIKQMSRFAATDRIRRRMAPRAAIITWYRLGGILAMILGVVMPTLLIAGIIGGSQ